MFLGDHAVAALSSVIVWFHFQQNKTLPTPEHVREWIRSRERVAPFE